MSAPPLAYGPLCSAWTAIPPEHCPHGSCWAVVDGRAWGTPSRNQIPVRP